MILLFNIVLWLAGFGVWTWLGTLSDSHLTMAVIGIFMFAVLFHISYRLITGKWLDAAVPAEPPTTHQHW